MLKFNILGQKIAANNNTEAPDEGYVNMKSVEVENDAPVPGDKDDLLIIGCVYKNCLLLMLFSVLKSYFFESQFSENLLLCLPFFEVLLLNVSFLHTKVFLTLYFKR